MITEFSQLDLSKRYSYADYLTWQFQERVELLKGWVKKMSPAPMDRHQKISFALSFELGKYFKKTACQVRVAPYDVRLLPGKSKSNADRDVYTVVQPDLCVICDPAKIDARGGIGAPDLIIEIVSPGNTKREMQDKFELYEECGVKEYWIVHPGDENIFVFSLKDEKYNLVKIYVQGTKVPSVVFPELLVDTLEVF